MGATFKKTNYRNCDHYGQARARIITGTYTGNGADNRNINIGVDLTAMSNVFILIRNAVNGVGMPFVIRTEHGQGDLSYPCGQINAADMIQAFNATGFQIGTNSYVNQNANLYIYVVMYEEVT